jgi:hypothetical protein
MTWMLRRLGPILLPLAWKAYRTRRRSRRVARHRGLPGRLFHL